MIEHFFVQSHVVARLKGSPLAPYLDDLATTLHQQGYAPSSIQRAGADTVAGLTDGVRSARFSAWAEALKRRLRTCWYGGAL